MGRYHASLVSVKKVGCLLQFIFVKTMNYMFSKQNLLHYSNIFISSLASAKRTPFTIALQLLLHFVALVTIVS